MGGKITLGERTDWDSGTVRTNRTAESSEPGRFGSIKHPLTHYGFLQLPKHLVDAIEKAKDEATGCTKMLICEHYARGHCRKGAQCKDLYLDLCKQNDTAGVCFILPTYLPSTAHCRSIHWSPHPHAGQLSARVYKLIH